MIFLISINGDESTNSVINWLRYNGAEYCRINFDDFFNRNNTISITPQNVNCVLKINEREFSKIEIEASVIWCRKLASFQQIKVAAQIKSKMGYIYNHLVREFTQFCDSLLSVFNDSYWLCHHSAKNLNKYNVLQTALKCGLKIPDTIITNSKDELQHFNCSKLSTKCLGDGLNISVTPDDIRLLSTTLLSSTVINELPIRFLPSMTQKYIDKVLELRIMFIDNVFFTTAIFSQEYENTKIDFRIITNGEKHCRMIPYQLPDDIKKLISELMSQINLNTGSIDMILGEDHNYYFLEVNPAGQYGWVADNCNYQIDEYIAIYLINKHNERNIKPISI